MSIWSTDSSHIITTTYLFLSQHAPQWASAEMFLGGLSDYADSILERNVYFTDQDNFSLRSIESAFQFLLYF